MVFLGLGVLSSLPESGSQLQLLEVQSSTRKVCALCPMATKACSCVKRMDLCKQTGAEEPMEVRGFTKTNLSWSPHLPTFDSSLVVTRQDLYRIFLEEGRAQQDLIEVLVVYASKGWAGFDCHGDKQNSSRGRRMLVGLKKYKEPQDGWVSPVVSSENNPQTRGIKQKLGRAFLGWGSLWLYK